jgi:hypothetical protein
MSERSINNDGTQYIRSRDAARIVQLAADYISRLARGGLIEGRIVNGLWFVTFPLYTPSSPTKNASAKFCAPSSRAIAAKSNA